MTRRSNDTDISPGVWLADGAGCREHGGTNDVPRQADSHGGRLPGGRLISLAKAQPGELTYGSGGTHVETVKALAQPDLRAKLADQGLEAIGNSPEEFAAIIQSETPTWAKLIKEAAIKPD